MTLRIERYKHTRHWALYDGADLVVVTVYRRGAREVQRRLTAQPRDAAEAAAQEAAREAAARQAQALAEQAQALTRQARAAAQAARARAQPGCEAGAAGGCPRQPSVAAPPGQAGRRRRAYPLVTRSWRARSHSANARHRRQPPHPATRGSPVQRACLGPRRSGVLPPPHPRRPARDCGARGFGGSAPMIPSHGWQPGRAGAGSSASCLGFSAGRADTQAIAAVTAHTSSTVRARATAREPLGDAGGLAARLAAGAARRAAAVAAAPTASPRRADRAADCRADCPPPPAGPARQRPDVRQPAAWRPAGGGSPARQRHTPRPQPPRRRARRHRSRASGPHPVCQPGDTEAPPVRANARRGVVETCT